MTEKGLIKGNKKKMKQTRHERRTKDEGKGD